MSRELVLLFHGIGRPPAHVTEEERPYWMPTGDFSSFLASAGTRARELGLSLVATIDDGNRSDREIAAPLLKRYAIRGIFFVCAGRIGHPAYLGADDISALQEEGFEIGSHGMDHVAWTGLEEAAMKREVAGSKAALQEILGREVGSAAIPFGAYNRRVLRSVRAAGYKTVYSSDSGLSRVGQWFQRRWCYRVDAPLDIDRLAAVSSTFRHRLVTASKSAIKSLR